MGAHSAENISCHARYKRRVSRAFSLNLLGFEDFPKPVSTIVVSQVSEVTLELEPCMCVQPHLNEYHYSEVTRSIELLLSLHRGIVYVFV